MSDVLTIVDENPVPVILWDSVLEAATLTTTATVDTDGDVDNVLGYQAYTWWLPTGGTLHIEATLDGSQEVSCWAMYGHDASGTVAMDTWNGAAWVEHSTELADGSGQVLYLRGDTITTTKLRFRFANISYLAVLSAGPELVMPTGVRAPFADPRLGQQARTEPEISRDGIWLGTTVQRWTLTQSVQFNNVSASWADTYWRPFHNQCASQPCFLHWNSTAWPDSAAYCTALAFQKSSFSRNELVTLGFECKMDVGSTP